MSNYYIYPGNICPNYYVYCNICGCPFDSSYVSTSYPGVTYDADVISEKQFEWLNRLSAIGHSDIYDEESKPQASIVFSASSDDFMYQSMIAGNLILVRNSSYPTIGTQETASLTSTAFPLHNACLEIVNRLLARRRSQTSDGDPDATLSAFHQRLIARRVSQSYKYDGQSSLEWEHEYYGAWSSWHDGSWESVPGFEFICAHPLDISAITAATLALLTSQTPLPKESSSVKRQAYRLPTSRFRSTIESLPHEVLTLITTHLSTRSILALRRTSQTLAASIPLSQSFWRDQLIYGHVVPYIWPGDLEAEECRTSDRSCDRDWETLVRTLMKPPIKLSNGFENWPDEPWVKSLPIGLQNRRRIWAIAAETYSYSNHSASCIQA